MSVKKDRFNKRKYRNARGGGNWLGNVPSGFRRDLNRWRRAQVSQLMRDGKFDFPRVRKDAAWLYW